MTELEYNGERYMVDGGQWYRRLKVGETIANGTESGISGSWHKSAFAGELVLISQKDSYRVLCTDPRPPFVFGQRVKVARKDGDFNTDLLDREGIVRSFWKGGEVFVHFEEI